MLSIPPTVPGRGVSVDNEKVLAREQVEEARENDTATCEWLDSVIGNYENPGRILLRPAHWSQRKIVVGEGAVGIAAGVNAAGVRE